MNQIESEFQNMRHKIYNQKVGLEQLLQTVLSQMVQINKMNEIEIKSYVN